MGARPLDRSKAKDGASLAPISLVERACRTFICTIFNPYLITEVEHEVMILNEVPVVKSRTYHKPHSRPATELRHSG